jgi:hypothetical protein
MTKAWLLTLAVGLFAGFGVSNAQEVTEETPPATEEVDETKAGYEELVAGQGDTAYAFDFFTTSMLWTVIAAAMVFIMHLGFATLEAGLTQKEEYGEHPLQECLDYLRWSAHLCPHRIQHALSGRI